MVRTSSPDTVGGQFTDFNAGTSTPGSVPLAADLNMWQEEMCHAVESAGLELSAANNSQLLQAIKAMSHELGELIHVEYKRETSLLFPAIDRSVDNDLAVANWPFLVPALRAVKASVLGETDFSVTVSGSVVTFPDTLAGLAIVKILAEDAKVSGWLNGGEDPGDEVADYTTSATKRCINVGGTDYAVAGVNTASRQVNVTGTPPSGAQTACCYTYRIAGSTTTARLHKITGFVGVAAGDADGEIVGGFRRMDRGQGHRNGAPGALDASYVVIQGASGGSSVSGVGGLKYSGLTATGDPVSDPTNGTPRTGKTTDPRTVGQYAYTWGGIYIAA